MGALRETIRRRRWVLRQNVILTQSVHLLRITYGSPVAAGFSPMRMMSASIFLPVFAIATMNIVHGITSTPEGTMDIAESMNFKNTTLNTTIRHMLPNIGRNEP